MWRRVVAAGAGPALIVACVLIVLHDEAFGGLVTNQHPDILAMWLPTFCFLGKTIAGGHVPAWNPHVMGGLPFAADPQSGWGYLPAMLLFSTLSCGRAIRWFIVLQPVLAGLGLYAFLRGEECSRAAATVGGLALGVGMAGSRLAVELPFSGTVAWTAVTLAAASRLVRASSWSGRLAWTAATAVAWGQIAEAHFSQGLFVGTGAVVAYLVSKTIAQRRPTLQALRLGALVVASFALVNLAVLLPRILYLRHSTEALGYARLATSSHAGAILHAPGLPAAWPVGFGASPGLYLGGGALVLAFAGWGLRRTRPVFLGFLAYAAILFVLTLSSVAGWIGHHAGGSRWVQVYLHAPERLRLAALVALAVAAGFGLDAWRAASTARERLVVLAPGVAFWAIVPPLVGMPWASLRILVAGVVFAVVALAAASSRRPLVVLLPIGLAAELVTAGLLARTAYDRDPTGRPVVTGVEAVPPLPSARVSPAAYLRSDPFADAIRASGARFATAAAGIPSRCLSQGGVPKGIGALLDQQQPCWPLLANQRSMLLNLEDAGGYNPVQLPRFFSLLRAIDRGAVRYNAAFVRPLSPQAIQLFQLGWWIQASGGRPPPDATLAATEGGFDLYRLHPAVPRASLFTSWRNASTQRDALRMVASSTSAELQRRAVVEASVPAPIGPQTPSRPATFRWTSPTSATVTVSNRGVVLVRTTFDRHWHASVDGRPARVFPADEVDQGIVVGVGHHVITLTYDDPAIGYGMLGSLLALALLSGGALTIRLLSRRAGTTT